MLSVSRQGKYPCQYSTANSSRTTEASGHEFLRHTLPKTPRNTRERRQCMRIRFYSYTLSSCSLIINGSMTSFVPRGYVDWRIFSLSLTELIVFFPTPTSPLSLSELMPPLSPSPWHKKKSQDSSFNTPPLHFTPLIIINHLLMTPGRKNIMMIIVSLLNVTKEARYHHHWHNQLGTHFFLEIQIWRNWQELLHPKNSLLLMHVGKSITTRSKMELFSRKFYLL